MSYIKALKMKPRRLEPGIQVDGPAECRLGFPQLVAEERADVINPVAQQKPAGPVVRKALRHFPMSLDLKGN
jgi:hypothetical protein